VARGDILGPEGLSLGQERVKLDELVAPHAGIWRVTPLILVHEVLNDMPMEGVPEVHHIVGNVELRANPARILDGAQGTARVLPLDDGQILLLRPHVQRDPDHGIAVASQERGRDGAVYAAAHPNEHSCRQNRNLLLS
jgi:hypothetical protein